MKLHLSLLAALVGAIALTATPQPPSADSVNSGLKVHYDDPSEAYHLTWWGIDTHYYFRFFCKFRVKS